MPSLFAKASRFSSELFGYFLTSSTGTCFGHFGNGALNMLISFSDGKHLNPEILGCLLNCPPANVGPLKF